MMCSTLDYIIEGSCTFQKMLVLCFFVAGMDQVWTAVGLGSLDGRFYAVGGECETTGHEGTLYLKSIECFDPRANCWSRIPNMQFPRSFAAVSSFNGENVYNSNHLCKEAITF